MSFQEKDKMADEINHLPFDQNNPSETEIQIVNALFKENYTNFEKLFVGLKDIGLLGVLFFIISLPQISEQIGQLYPYTLTSPYVMAMIKAVIFMGVYFVIKNLYLVQKQ